ncbi:MAG: glycosyltransferase family 2 protein [Saccharofermentanales bacterium]
MMNETLIIIPAYNEGKNIRGVLDRIKAQNLSADVVVINDGSKDDTEAVVRASKTDIITLPYNLGYGGALQTGFQYASHLDYKNIIQIDADGQHDPGDIRKIMDYLETTGVDIAIGSRFMEGGHFDAGVTKKLGMGFLKIFIRSLTRSRITDPTSGLKGLTNKIFKYYAFSDTFSPDYPDADILIQVMRAGFSIGETPITVVGRSQGQSMHSGLKPVYYFVKFILNISVILLREKMKGGYKS